MRLINTTIILFLMSGCHGASIESNEENEEQVLVFISNEAIQCEFKGLMPAETAQKLINIGVDVIESQCGMIGGGVMALCGLSTQEINIHTIHSQNVEDAKGAGFRPVSFIEEIGLDYGVTSCSK